VRRERKRRREKEEKRERERLACVGRLLHAGLLPLSPGTHR